MPPLLTNEKSLSNLSPELPGPISIGSSDGSDTEMPDTAASNLLALLVDSIPIDGPGIGNGSSIITCCSYSPILDIFNSPLFVPVKLNIP